MNGFTHALPLLLRRRAAVADLLPVIAFAAATAVIATVLGGTLAFARRAAAISPETFIDGVPTPEQSLIQALPGLAMLACVLLLPPAVSLGGAAGRLSLARREKQLATMRLLGATTRQVGAVALLDVAAQALIGGVIGLLAHLLVAIPLTRLDFGTTPFTAAELRLPTPLLSLPAMLLGMVLLAAASAAIALQAVAISPLGVARQSRPVKMSVLRLLLFVAVAVVFVVLTGPLSPLQTSASDTTAMIVVLGVMGFMLLNINVVGPFLIWVTALVLARTARTPAMLVGARRLAADPRAGWRSISVITIAMVISGLLSLLVIIGQQGSTEPDPTLVAMQTGGGLTLAIAAVLGAVSTGVMQAARVLDQLPVLRSQAVAGATVSQLQRSRMVEILVPLALSSVVAVFTALILITPVLSGGILTLGVAVRFVVSVLVSYAMVIAAALASSPLIASAARGARGVRMLEA